jgi:hypothetical protein
LPKIAIRTAAALIAEEAPDRERKIDEETALLKWARQFRALAAAMNLTAPRVWNCHVVISRVLSES